MTSVEEFYDVLAEHYDRMVRFEDRLEQEKAVLAEWISGRAVQTGLDLGCGTGLHTIALARLGVRMTGVDPSPEMLARARQNARRHGQKEIHWVQASLEDFPQHLPQRFDLIVCLGNTLAHVPPAQLHTVFTHLFGALEDSGILLLQLLNYKPILQKKERILDVRRVQNDIFIRFYDFLSDRLRFNLLILQETQSGLSHLLQSTELFPHFAEDLLRGLESAGFVSIQMFGNLQAAPFEPRTSRNLVIRAARSQA